MSERIRVPKRILKLARSYAVLDPEREYPDMNAAIELAKFILRKARQ